MFRLGLIFLLIAGLLGFLLRAMVVFPFEGLNYRYFLHAHSHTAFLAWVFNAFFAFALQHFANEGQIPTFSRIFKLLQVTNIGMLLSFPLQGYAAWSIAFSTLHMIISFVFAWKLFRQSRLEQVGRAYLRVALIFMAVSSLGPLSLGPLAALDLRNSPWYTLSIYFYMHFQYNGWFVFFLLAAVIALSRRSPKVVHAFRAAFPWLVIGSVLTLAQTAIWVQFSQWVNFAALAGSILQLIGCGIVFFRIHNLNSTFISPLPSLSRLLIRFALTCLILKFMFQFAGSLPGLESLASHRYAAIGFLHLVFLGVVTPALIAWAMANRWLSMTPISTAGIYLYLASVLFGEAVLFYIPIAAKSNWIALPHSPEFLAVAAGTTMLSLMLLLLGSCANSKHASTLGNQISRNACRRSTERDRSPSR